MVETKSCSRDCEGRGITDEGTSRFLSEDPARDGVSWYGYCGGNPIGRVDPWGLDQFTDQVDRNSYNSKKNDPFLAQAERNSREVDGSVFAPEVIPIPAEFNLPENWPIWPVLGKGENTMTDRYGMRIDPFTGVERKHGGIDIGVPSGTKVLSVLSGKVKAVGNDRIYGNYIEIEHGDFGVTKYGHLKNLPELKEGQEIMKATVLGFSGNTGSSTGPHLHFEYRVNGETRDPLYTLYAEFSVMLRR